MIVIIIIVVKEYEVGESTDIELSDVNNLRGGIKPSFGRAGMAWQTNLTKVPNLIITWIATLIIFIVLNIGVIVSIFIFTTMTNFWPNVKSSSGLCYLSSDR